MAWRHLTSSNALRDTEALRPRSRRRWPSLTLQPKVCDEAYWQKHLDSSLLGAVQLLVKQKGSNNTECDEGVTVLALAVSQCKTELVRGLVALGTRKRVEEEDCTSNTTGSQDDQGPYKASSTFIPSLPRQNATRQVMH